MMPDRTLVGLISQVFIHLAIIVARQKVSRQESSKGFVPLSECVSHLLSDHVQGLI
jgi:hypothetical protein